MIGQQKRSLEHTAFSQPVKYQKHLDEDVSETHTRVPSIADEEIQRQQYLSEVSEKAPPTDATHDTLLEGETDSELRVLIEVDEASKPENGECWGSAEGFYPSEERVRTCSKEDRNRGGEVDTMHSRESSGLHCTGDVRIRDTAIGPNDPGTSKAGAFLGEQHENSGSRPGSISGDSSLPHLRNDRTGLHRDSMASSITGAGENKGDEDALDVVHEMSQSRHRRCPQAPLPIVMSEKAIDLYEMDERVQSCGGYDAVTSEGLWGNISEGLGLSADCGPGLKLVYFKHSKDLERARGRSVDGDRGSGLPPGVNTRGAVLSRDRSSSRGKSEHYSTKVGEQFAESEPFHGRTVERRVNGGSSYDKIDDRRSVYHSDDETEMGMIRSTKDLGKGKVRCRADRDQYDHSVLESSGVSQDGRDGSATLLSDRRFLKAPSDHHNFVVARHGRHQGKYAEDQANLDRALLERENKMLTDTLTWIKRMALYAGNPPTEEGSDGTGGTEKWAQECESRAWKIRSLLWKLREDARQGDGHLHQLRQSGAPSHYYEEVPRQEQQVLDRLRVTRERIAHYGSTVQKPLHESATSQRGSPSSLSGPQWVGQSGYRVPRQGHYYVDERFLEEFTDRYPRKRIPIGPDFQARIPSCKDHDLPSSVVEREKAEVEGDDSQRSDEEKDDASKWLGERVWPPPEAEDMSNNYQLGRSRYPFCSCVQQGSVDCVRTHVLEARHRLKREIGEAFHVWKFDQMGESVADGWGKAEERVFRDLVRMNPPSQDKNFWSQLPAAFPGKTTEELVSYYFNVFVLRRRAIQNRLEEKHVDSDDDETELPEGSSDDSDGYESGDEGEDETYEYASEDEEDADKGDGPFAGTSARILEGAGLCDRGSGPVMYKSKMGVVNPSERSEGVPLALRTGRRMGLEGVQHRYHESHREEGLRTGRLPGKWGPDHHDDDDEKHLEEHVAVVGEEELEEVQTWEVSHWDEAPRENLPSDQVANDRPAPKSDRSVLCTENVQCLFKKETDVADPQTVASCEGEVWGTTMEIAPAKARDKLLSTNGMIEEIFGHEASSASLDAST